MILMTVLSRRSQRLLFWRLPDDVVCDVEIAETSHRQDRPHVFRRVSSALSQPSSEVAGRQNAEGGQDDHLGIRNPEKSDVRDQRCW